MAGHHDNHKDEISASPTPAAARNSPSVRRGHSLCLCTPPLPSPIAVSLQRDEDDGARSAKGVCAKKDCPASDQRAKFLGPELGQLLGSASGFCGNFVSGRAARCPVQLKAVPALPAPVGVATQPSPGLIDVFAC